MQCEKRTNDARQNDRTNTGWVRRKSYPETEGRIEMIFNGPKKRKSQVRAPIPNSREIEKLVSFSCLTNTPKSHHVPYIILYEVGNISFILYVKRMKQ